jgi:hypothetical protein
MTVWSWKYFHRMITLKNITGTYHNAQQSINILAFASHLIRWASDPTAATEECLSMGHGQSQVERPGANYLSARLARTSL